MKLSGTVTFTDVRSPHQGTSKTCNIGSSAPCSVTTQRDGIGSGREVQEGGNICIFMVDSHFCTAETNTTLENNCYPIKNKFKKNNQLQSQGFPGSSEGKESFCNVGEAGSNPGLGRSPGERSGNPLQYSCLENSTERRAWRGTVHEIAKSQTRLSD